MAYLTVKKDISFWPVSEEWSVIFSRSKGKSICIPTEWKDTLLSKVCDLKNDFDDQTLQLFIDYGLLQTANDNVDQNTENDIIQNRKLNTLSLVISEGCNFKCPHCIHANDIKSGATRTLNTYMSKDVVKSSVDKFFSHAKNINNHDIDVEFGAAEPLINWTAIEYTVNYIKDNYQNFNTTYHMTTNLVLVTDYQTKFFIENNFKISTSLDGNKIANDAVRMDMKGHGTYDKIVQKIETMKKKGYGFDAVNLTLTKDNIKILDVEQYLDTVQSMGMNGIGLDFDVVTSEDLSVDYVCERMLKIYDSCKKRGLYCVGTWLHPAENMLNPDFQEDNVFCKAVAGQNISVTPQGTLHMCNFTSTHLGTLDKFDEYGVNLKNLIDSREYFVKNHCEKCDLKSSCRGQCHTTLEVAPEIRHQKIEFMCNFYRKLTKEVVIRSFSEQLKNAEATE